MPNDAGNTHAPSARRLEAEMAVVRALAEAPNLKDAVKRILEAVCVTCGWEWAALWTVDQDAGCLRNQEIWKLDSVRSLQFDAMSKAIEFTRGVGLPGRVWERGEPAWVEDVTKDDNFPRRHAAAEAGLHGAVCFPVRRGREVMAVMEFFSHAVRSPDEELLLMMSVIGGQIGQYMDRRRAEEALLSSEARHAAVIETALDCIVSMDSRGRVIEWNPASAQTFGYTRDEAMGKDMAELIISPAMRPMHRKGLTHYLSTGEGPVIGKRLEITGMRKGGVEFPVELSITRVPSDGPATFLGFLRDITPRKEAEQERSRLLAAEQEARQEAEAANSTKDEFLATVSHELRTPLNAILGWTQLLRTTRPGAGDVEHGLDVIERNSRSMAELVEDVLDVSRIVQGKLRLEMAPVDLARIIDEAVETVRPAAQGKQIDVQWRKGEPVGAVSGDARRLLQAIWNLLSNAIKFTPAGGHVEIRLERIGSRVRVSVTDSGEGVSPEFLPQMFKRFSQADTSSRRRHAGLGLGLAIVRHVVELHGGTVSVQSEGKGRGATFSLEVPAGIVIEGVKGPSRGDTSDAPGRVRVLEGMHIMVVDDETDARDLISAILTHHGGRASTAASAREAIAAMRLSRPDVLLSDIGMPVEDGYDLLARVRELENDTGWRIPAVALTAFARAEDAHKALAAGFRAHMPKPVEPQDLILLVARLGKRR